MQKWPTEDRAVNLMQKIDGVSPLEVFIDPRKICWPSTSVKLSISPNATVASAAFLTDCDSVSKIRRKDSAGSSAARLRHLSSSADAEFLQTCHDVACAASPQYYMSFSICPVILHICFYVLFLIS